MWHATSNRHASRKPPGPSYRRVIAGIPMGRPTPARTPYTRDMRPPRPPRDPQRGNSLVLALIVMSALATLGSLTVVSMQSSLQTSTNDRAQTIAMYAAESGAAVAMDFLRKNFDASGAIFSSATSWSTYCTANNAPPLVQMSAYIPSSDAQPGDPNNLFDRDQNAWFHIDVLNNRDDPGYPTNTSTCDTDGVVIIRSTGHGPQGSLVIIEWEVQRVGYWGASPPAQAVFALRNGNGFAPSLPWYQTSPVWLDNWAPLPFPTFQPPSFPSTGMVLLGWHVVSL
jgi:Tfp pilus assembly protein PilX